MKALSIQEVRKVYATGVEALKGVSLEMEEGDFFSLLGPNGAGKTTLINIISQLVNKTSGVVRVFGRDIDKSPDEAKSMIGIVPQEFNFNIFEKVEDIVITQAGYYGVPRKVAVKETEMLLKQLGLWEKRRQVSMSLSGGMKRRLLIARALVHRPKLLVLDEPTAGVDIELRRGMWDYLRTLTAKGISIILTTHYLEEAEQLSDHVAIINHGQVVKQGSVKDLLSGLNQETFIFDFKEAIPEGVFEELKKVFDIKKVDENSLEVSVTKEHPLGNFLKILQEKALTVLSMRNKANRLEEVFLNLVQKPAHE